MLCITICVSLANFTKLVLCCYSSSIHEPISELLFNFKTIEMIKFLNSIITKNIRKVTYCIWFYWYLLNFTYKVVTLQKKIYYHGWRYSKSILIALMSIMKTIKRLPRQDNSLNILFPCNRIQQYKIPVNTMTLFVIYFN